jgi:hypothetical protein
MVRKFTPDNSMATIQLEAFQKEVLQQEIGAIAQRVSNSSEAYSRYVALLNEIERGEITDECSGALEGILDVLLESGRARHLYGPPGEHTLTALFQRTPRGATFVQQGQTVTRALSGLEGQVLSNFSVRSSGPGAWAFTLQTDRCELTLQIDRRGIQVKSLDVDIGA